MDRKILALLAEVLGYPGPDLAGAARRCAAMLSADVPCAAGAPERFAAWVARDGLAPALGKMAAVPRSRERPYGLAVEAAREVVAAIAASRGEEASP